jgi:hypothetical protein
VRKLLTMVAFASMVAANLNYETWKSTCRNKVTQMGQWSSAMASRRFLSPSLVREKPKCGPIPCTIGQILMWKYLWQHSVQEIADNVLEVTSRFLFCERSTILLQGRTDASWNSHRPSNQLLNQLFRLICTLGLRLISSFKLSNRMVDCYKHR